VIHPQRHDEQRDQDSPKRDPIVLSPEYLAAIREVEALRCNQDGVDKTWVHHALDEMQRHFANVKRA